MRQHNVNEIDPLQFELGSVVALSRRSVRQHAELRPLFLKKEAELGYLWK